MSGSDDVRRLSDELARDPSSLVFLHLGELLRRQGQLDLARKVAMRGLERHPHNAEAHDLLARIFVDRGELERAFDEWDMVLRLEPAHAGALKGMGFVCFRDGRLREAEQYLAAAAAGHTDDASIVAALAHVRERLAAPSSGDGASADAPAAEAPGTWAEPGAQASGSAWGVEDRGGAGTPERGEGTAENASGRADGGDPRMLFAGVIGDGEQTALLLDAAGLVLAGVYVAPDGYDVAQEVGAELSGVSDEAQRAMRHLGLGAWTSIVFESEAAIVAMAPAPRDTLLLVAAARSTPLGSVRRLLDRAGAHVRWWLGGEDEA